MSRANQRQRIEEAQGKDVPLDFFLYACLEHERTVTPETRKIQWSELVDHDEEALNTKWQEVSLSDLIRQLMSWYAHQHPEMIDGAPIDHEKLSKIVGPLVSMNQDISAIYKIKTGDDLPSYEASVGNLKIWDDVSQTIDGMFSYHHTYFNRYIEWSHAAGEQPNTDDHSRPPVGRFAPRRSHQGRGGRNDNRSGGGGGRQQGRQQGGGRRDRFDDNRRGGGGNNRNNRRNQGDRPPRDAAQTAKLEESALAEVASAIKSLETDKALDEVTLKPANSFYRRIQHQRAVDLGYMSFSVGEGKDRAVKVARKLD